MGPRAALLLLLAACGGGGDALLPTARVERGELRIELSATGELKAIESVSLSAPDMGGQAKVTQIAEEGTRVQEGDLLVSFDTSELDRSLLEAQSGLEISRTKIAQNEAQLQVRLADLENEVVRAELALERAKMRVTDSETVPLVERHSAKLDVQESTLGLERARASLESARLEGEAELQLLRIDVRQAEREVAEVERRIASATIRAPGAGLVILPEIWKGGSRGQVTVGDTVWGGSTLMELPDLGAMRVEAWVHEVDVGEVAPGQPVEVVIDAWPDPPHPGTVKRVADLAVKRDRDSDVKYVKLEVELARTDPKMKPGMTVRAEVLVDRVEDALQVPREAVVREGERSFVRRRGLGGWTEVDVVTGAQNDTHVVVLEGLAEGDEVALVDPARFEAGEAAPTGAPPGNGSGA
jgi:RND family efflux transporter MFP subunit